MDWRKTPRHLSCVLLLAAAALPLAAITPAPTAKTCEALTQWARYNRESLPRDYRGLLAYPASEQRAIYSNMSAGEKAGYWNGRIGAYLEEHPDLTAVQQRAIAEARTFVKAELFEGMPVNTLSDQELARFEQRMISGLGEKATRELFYGFDSAATEQHAVAVACECHTFADCFRITVPATYCDNSEPCEMSVGCGFMSNLPCTGMCR